MDTTNRQCFRVTPGGAVHAVLEEFQRRHAEAHAARMEWAKAQNALTQISTPNGPLFILGPETGGDIRQGWKGVSGGSLPKRARPALANMPEGGMLARFDTTTHAGRTLRDSWNALPAMPGGAMELTAKLGMAFTMTARGLEAVSADQTAGQWWLFVPVTEDPVKSALKPEHLESITPAPWSAYYAAKEALEVAKT